MEEAHRDFLDFDWADERWVAYLSGLYPPPAPRQVVKFKKKWYKKNIDADFDETYEPPPEPTNSGGGYCNGGSTSSSYAPPPHASTAHQDGHLWACMGTKATICFLAYSGSMTLSIGAMAGVFPAYQALLVLVSAFLLELLAKYGFKFSTEYLHTVLLDDVGVMPMMTITLLTPGMHPLLRVLALVSPSLSALLSFSQICKAHKRLPASLRAFFAPLAEVSARYQVMQLRADVEVALGVALVLGVLTIRAAPISALLFWNFMMMRYMMSCWTQTTFSKIDGVLHPVLGKIPGINYGYAAVKRKLFSFVDPETRRAGRLCSIL